MHYERLPQSTSPLWFLRNGASMIYFIRELTGLVISVYCMYFAYLWFGDEAMNFIRTKSFYVVSIITFGACIFHTVTWLWVTTQVTPMPLPKKIQYALFVALLGIFGGVSYVLSLLFYK